MFSRSTLDLFANLLAGVRLDPLADNAPAALAQLRTARDELMEAFKEVPVVLPLAESTPEVADA